MSLNRWNIVEREWERVRDRKRERFKAACYTAYITRSASPIGRKLTQLRTETVVSAGIKRLRKGTRLIFNSELRIRRAVLGKVIATIQPQRKEKKNLLSPDFTQIAVQVSILSEKCLWLILRWSQIAKAHHICDRKKTTTAHWIVTFDPSLGDCAI